RQKSCSYKSDFCGVVVIYSARVRVYIKLNTTAIEGDCRRVPWRCLPRLEGSLRGLELCADGRRPRASVHLARLNRAGRRERVEYVRVERGVSLPERGEGQRVETAPLFLAPSDQSSDGAMCIAERHALANQIVREIGRHHRRRERAAHPVRVELAFLERASH